MINVLLIEDNPGDARMIRELFVEAKATSVALVCADRLSQGLAMLSEGGIDIVLLDLSLTDSKGFETFVKVREKAREIPVIVLTGLDDEVLAMRTVREGAQDYIVKGSVTPHALTRCIRFALERHKTRVVEPAARRKSSPGRVLGFMGAKGGVGTTTVALNAAAILAGPNKTVIALELRPLGSSFCLQLQQTPNRNLSHLMDLEVDLLTEEAIKTCLVSLPSGMSTLCAAQKTDQFREIRPEQVEALIRCAAQIADYVIIDLPSEVCGFSQSAVRACDLMTVVVERDPTCLAAGRVAVQSLEEWGVEAHALSAVIVIKDALRAFVSVEELGIRLGCSIAGSIAPAYDLCLASARAGTPLAVLDPDSIAAANLTTMAEKLASPILAAALVLV